jgi:hypothetical protein
MGKWNVVDNQTGSTLVFEGDAPPTEKQLDNLFAEKSITSGTGATNAPALAPAPAAAPSGPGFFSRLGTAVQTLPPVSMVARGAANLINPLIASQRAAVPIVAEGAKNLVRPFVPSSVPDASALIGGPDAVKAWGNVFSPPPGPPQDNPPAGPITFPAAPLTKSERVKDKVYMTPAGPRRWTGEAWLRLS